MPLKLLLLSLVIFISCISFATQETTHINIEVTKTNFVNFIGTAVGASRFYAMDEVELGDTLSLGLSSNLSDDCTLEFSTQNNFRLRHLISNRRLTRFRLRYNNTNITRNRNRTMDIPCNSTPTDISFEAVGNFRNNTEPGIYQDIVTITVTSP